MKTRSAISIIGIVLALIAMFAALPAQAYESCNPDTDIDFQYDGVDDFFGYWQFVWKTVERQNSYRLQVKGGGIINVWTTVHINSYEEDSDESRISITEVDHFSGETLYFRVRVKCDYKVTIDDETSVTN